MTHPVWPLFDLRVVTPRIEMRYPDDAAITALAALAARGVHDPDTMPFLMPWTDTAAGGPLERGSMQFLWRSRVEWTPAKWHLPFAVYHDGEIVGLQDMNTHDFAVGRTFESGSWLGLEFQGRGIGTEMRSALLHFAFDGLDAEVAYTSAWHDNMASLGVTQRLGYRPNGESLDVRRGDRAERMLRFRLPRDDWAAQRRDDVTIEGFDACRVFFGLADGW